MTAIEALKAELHKIDRLMCDCVSPDGYVHNHAKYKYKILVEQARSIREAIQYLEALKEEKSIVKT